MSASLDTTVLSYPSYIRADATGYEAELRQIFRNRGPKAIHESEVALIAAKLLDENGLLWENLLEEMLADPRGSKKLTAFSSAVRKAERTLRQQRKQEAKERIPFGDWRDSEDWLTFKNGEPVPSEQNTILALRSIPELFGRFRWNELSKSVFITEALPWNIRVNRQVDDTDLTNLAAYLQRHTGMVKLTRDTCWNSMASVSRDFAFHPVRDYLSGLEWDGTTRMPYLAQECLKSESPQIAEVMLRKWLLSAVARVFRPGCKADHMLILEGAQGIMKSTFFSVLGGEYHCEDIKDVGSKDAKLLLGRAWIVEVAELAGLGRRSAKEIKQEITIIADEFRSPYGRTPEKFMRTFVWAGTSNPEAAGTFKDETGNRRFWPILVMEKIDIAWLRTNRDQLWAEAVALYIAGTETWYMDSEEDCLAVEAEQENRRVRHEWHEPIAAYLSGSPAQAVLTGLSMETIGKANRGDGQPIQVVSLPEIIAALGITMASIRGTERYKIAPILKDLGYDRKQVQHNGVRDWYYVKRS